MAPDDVSDNEPSPKEATQDQAASVALAESTPSKKPKLSRTRSITSWVLVVVVSILFPLSVMAVWITNTLTNTDHFVTTMAPIATNPVIINNASTRITNELFSSLDVQKRIEKVLPAKAAPVAAPLTSTLHDFVYKQVHRTLSSPYFAKIWNNGNRRVSSTLVAVMSGQSTKTTRALRNGRAVVINITPIATKAISSLDAKGITFFDPLKQVFNSADKYVSITLLTQQQVHQATGIFNLVKKLKWAVPLITLVLAAAAIGISVRRRKTLLRVALGGSIGIVVFLIALRLVRRSAINTSVKQDLNPQSTAIIFDTLLRYLKDGLWLVLVILLVIAVITWFVGPARYAVALRHQIARAWNWLVANAKKLSSTEPTSGASPATQRVAGWIDEHRSALRLLGAIVAACYVVFNGSLTFWSALITLVLLAVYLGIIQLVVIWAKRIGGGPGTKPDVDSSSSASVGSSQSA